MKSLVNRHVNLRPRLNAVSEMLGNSEVVVDIGCDHGRLAVSLLQTNKAKRVIACDISAASVRKAEWLRDKCNMAERMDVRLSDGLNGIAPGDADSAVIAGMGGKLISEILSHNMNISQAFDSIVMQPMRGVADLRRFLHDNCFIVTDDRLVLDSGRIYQILRASYTGNKDIFPEEFPKEFYEIGHMSFQKSPDLAERLLLNMVNAYSSSIEQAGMRGKELKHIAALRDKTNMALEYFNHILTNKEGIDEKNES